MSMDSCYNYCLQKSENGNVEVMGSCFVEGKRYQLNSFKKLNASQKAQLAKIPFGLLLSNVKTTESKNDVGEAVMVLDDGSFSCCITYGDGKTDSKICDNKIIVALDELMKKVFSK